MNKIAWKLRRLKAMSLQEVGVRVARMLREKLSPLPKETPEQTWTQHCSDTPAADWLGTLPSRLSVHVSAADQCSEMLAEAEELLEGRMTLFGHLIQLDDPPNWNRNYVLGKDWHNVPAHDLDYRAIDIAGGVKYTWEISRHAILLRLAQAYSVTGDARYAETCLRWWLDWIERNPRGWGIHWTSALEHAIRVFTWTYALRLLKDYEPIRDAASTLAGALIQHGEFIERHLSPGSSANNHLIGEAASLAFIGSLLPESNLSQRWQRIGFKILEEQAERQFYEDGVNAEQAFGYLPFVWEFYLHAYRVASQPMPSIVRERLVKNLEFVRNVMDESGYVPQVGDEDDGTVAPFWSQDANRYAVVGRALAQLLGCEPMPAISEQDDTLCLWLHGKPSESGSFIHESCLYPIGGYAVMKSFAQSQTIPYSLLLDFGSLGLGSIAAHGHADALSVMISVEGEPFVVDTGTYAYHEDPRWRDYFRGTAAHNTLMVNNEHQSEMLGAFLWGRRATARLIESNLQSETPEIIAEHDGYAPIIHRRTVRSLPDRIEVIDQLHGSSDAVSFKVHWHFHPDWKAELINEHTVYLTTGDKSVHLNVEATSGGQLQILRAHENDSPAGWYSSGFGQRQPCNTLRWSVSTKLPVTIVWIFERLIRNLD